MAGDQAGYRDACARMLDRLDRRSPSANAELAAYLSASTPGAVKDYTRPIDLARQALAAIPADKPDQRHAVLNTLGGLQVRAGDHAGAMDSLHKGLNQAGEEAVAQDWAFLAMASRALGDGAEVRPPPTPGLHPSALRILGGGGDPVAPPRGARTGRKRRRPHGPVPVAR